MNTPWGRAQTNKQIGSAVWSITTTDHGGVLVTEPALSSIQQEVRDDMINQASPARLWAEEDWEMPIIISILLAARQLAARQLDAHIMRYEHPATVKRDADSVLRIDRIANEICEHDERYANCRPFLPAIEI